MSAVRKTPSVASNWNTAPIPSRNISGTELPYGLHLNFQNINNVVISLDTNARGDFNQHTRNGPAAVVVSKAKRINKLKPARPPVTETANIPLKPKKKKKPDLGDCPICLDPLGKNQLASTKCGHVFCVRCLERALLIEKRCPSCRKLMKNNKSYHLLFVGLNGS